jgi:hypothetical protein
MRQQHYEQREWRRCQLNHGPELGRVAVPNTNVGAHIAARGIKFGAS